MIHPETICNNLMDKKEGIKLKKAIRKELDRFDSCCIDFTYYKEAVKSGVINKKSKNTIISDEFLDACFGYFLLILGKQYSYKILTIGFKTDKCYKKYLELVNKQTSY